LVVAVDVMVVIVEIVAVVSKLVPSARC